MLIFRFLLFSLVTSFGIVAVRADAVAPQTGEKPKPAATAEPGITFDWVHLMVRSQPGKKNGSTRSLVTKLCFGMSIHWTGEGQDRMWFAIASSKWLAPARLFWRTTFIPARSRRCRAC